MLLDEIGSDFFCATFCLKVCGLKHDGRVIRQRRWSFCSTLWTPYLLEPLGVILHGTLQTLQLQILPGGPFPLDLGRLGLARLGHRLGWGVPLEGVGHLEVIWGAAVLHFGEDEGEAAGAMLHVVLLALRADCDGEQVGQMDDSQGQQAAHVRGKGGTGEKMLLHLEEQRSGSNKFTFLGLLLKSPRGLLFWLLGPLVGTLQYCCVSVLSLYFTPLFGWLSSSSTSPLQPCLCTRRFSWGQTVNHTGSVDCVLW